MVKTRFLVLTTLVAVCGGCHLFSSSPTNRMDGEVSLGKTNQASVAALICSMTHVNTTAYNGWDGYCLGTDVDSATFRDMCKQFSVPYVKLENEQANYANIYARAKEVVQTLAPDGLLILYFSGHGGQVDSIASNESDGLDETICLWDGQLRDKDVWKLLCQVPSTMRIWMVTDCCNSGTNYRRPPNFSRLIKIISKDKVLQRFLKAERDTEPNLLHWGGCDDGHSSFGGKDGGVFTTTMVDTFDTTQTYRQWFQKILKAMPNDQTPTCGETGVSFQDSPVFH